MDSIVQVFYVHFELVGTIVHQPRRHVLKLGLATVLARPSHAIIAWREPHFWVGKGEGLVRPQQIKVIGEEFHFFGMNLDLSSHVGEVFVDHCVYFV